MEDCTVRSACSGRNRHPGRGFILGVCGRERRREAGPGEKSQYYMQIKRDAHGCLISRQESNVENVIMIVLYRYKRLCFAEIGLAKLGLAKLNPIWCLR